jgi:hypothetical protein
VLRIITLMGNRVVAALEHDMTIFLLAALNRGGFVALFERAAV